MWVKSLQGFEIYLSDAFVPALDNLALSNLELEGLAPIAGRIELLSVGQRARVMDNHGLTLLRVCRSYETFLWYYIIIIKILSISQQRHTNKISNNNILIRSSNVM